MRAMAPTCPTQPTTATAQPIAPHFERKSSAALRSGWCRSTAGAATAPRCFHRNARFVAIAVPTANSSPSTSLGSIAGTSPPSSGPERSRCPAPARHKRPLSPPAGRPGTVGAMDPVVIQCAVTGSQAADPERRPNLPSTPDAIADEATAAWRAGAAVIHLHAREADGTPTQDLKAYADLVERVRARGCEAILNLSTGTAGGNAVRDERYALLELEPEMASFDCGTINFGERIFEGDLPFLRRMAEAFRRAGTIAELECFDTGYVGLARQLLDESLLDEPLRVQFVVGIPGTGVPPTIAHLEHLRAMLDPSWPWLVAAP